MTKTSAAETTVVLREHIMSGQITPGKHLQQEPLAKSLGVSRTPLRTALSDLAKEGLLIYEPNRGYTVQKFETADIVDAYDTRAVLEGLAAAKAARQGWDTAQVDEMIKLLAQGDALLADGNLDPIDVDAYRNMNVIFHDKISFGTKNRWIKEFVRQTQMIPFASNRMIVWEDYEIMKRAHDDHHRILDAIIRGDATRAEYMMREHVCFAGEYLAQCVEEGRLSNIQNPEKKNPTETAE